MSKVKKLTPKQREITMCLVDDLANIIMCDKNGNWFVKKHCEEVFEEQLVDMWNVRFLKTKLCQ